MDERTKMKESDFKDLCYAMQQQNLVYNYNFLYYSNKDNSETLVDYKHPDGWVFSDKDGSIGFNTDNNCCQINTGAGKNTMTLSQALHEFPRWKSKLAGETISSKAHMNLSDEAEIKFSLSDGITTESNSIVASGDIELQVHLKVSIQAKYLILKIECMASNTVINISKVYANVGNIALDSLPCIVQGVIGERKQYIATETPPAEELSLCCEPIELSNIYTRLNSVLNGRFGIGDNGNSILLDMRGYFSRAWNNGSETDPDANNRRDPETGQIKGDHVSTFEKDVFLKHQHGLDFAIGSAAIVDKGPNTTLVTSTKSDTNLANNGKETRPKNIAELYTIKWA